MIIRMSAMSAIDVFTDLHRSRNIICNLIQFLLDYSKILQRIHNSSFLLRRALWYFYIIGLRLVIAYSHVKSTFTLNLRYV